ncbi:CBS domain-containing protein [Streptomyces sp. B4I13]|uniref:CBS domain-containing protein n=1 Tax=Streptomyces sp. B4I13 TaxID=3042271 RepID=UPI00278568CE|nr:CBS domain-containing protein [Streptomyces sp. B4I13]
MTPAQTQYRTTAHPATMALTTATAMGDGVDAHAPRVSDDMTVEVALAVMAGARVGYLTVCDGDDQSTGVVTLARLAALRVSSAYTDRIRLRDVLDGSPRPRGIRSGARPGDAGEHARTPGGLALSH